MNQERAAEEKERIERILSFPMIFEFGGFKLFSDFNESEIKDGYIYSIHLMQQDIEVFMVDVEYDSDLYSCRISGGSNFKNNVLYGHLKSSDLDILKEFERKLALLDNLNVDFKYEALFMMKEGFE